MATSAAPGGARLTLVLGGARSGKSRYAESLVMALPAPWIYVATAEARDTEMAERIAAHQARRGAGWRTLETPRDVVGALAAHGTTPLLVDCLTLWLSNERLEAVLGKAAGPLVLVANEVGFGIVPDNALGRRFRDLQGLLNQRIAARADRVVLVVAGVPLTIKGSP